MSEKINANQDNDRQITLVDEQGNEELFEILFTLHLKIMVNLTFYYIQQLLVMMMMLKYKLSAMMQMQMAM